MRVLLARLLLLALMAGSACTKKVEPDPEPAPPVLEPIDNARNVLLNPNGYWEWIRRSWGFGNVDTPVSVGFSRQLVFKNDGHIYIYHDQVLVLQPPYLLTNRQGVICTGSARPHVEYIGESTPRQVSNTDLRSILITVPPAGSGSDTVLTLIGDGQCLDGAATESYRWHHR